MCHVWCIRSGSILVYVISDVFAISLYIHMLYLLAHAVVTLKCIVNNAGPYHVCHVWCIRSGSALFIVIFGVFAINLYIYMLYLLTHALVSLIRIVNNAGPDHMCHVWCI